MERSVGREIGMIECGVSRGEEGRGGAWPSRKGADVFCTIFTITGVKIIVLINRCIPQ